MEEFKTELIELLKKHDVAIIAKSNNHPKDLSIELGFQKGIHNKWLGRHHLTAYELGHVKMYGDLEDN